MSISIFSLFAYCGSKIWVVQKMNIFVSCCHFVSFSVFQKKQKLFVFHLISFFVFFSLFFLVFVSVFKIGTVFKASTVWRYCISTFFSLYFIKLSNSLIISHLNMPFRMRCYFFFSYSSKIWSFIFFKCAWFVFGFGLIVNFNCLYVCVCLFFGLVRILCSIKYVAYIIELVSHSLCMRK